MTPDNPQAFPAPYCVGPNDDIYPALPGMTLRDWIAGQAMAGLIESSLRIRSPLTELSRACYEAADAMLAERERNQ